jgi:hypothetical protein
MTDIEDLMDRVEDIVGDLLIVSDTLDKGVSAMDSMTDAIDDLRVNNDEKREIARFMVRFMLAVINDVVPKLGEIKRDLEDVSKELETMG